MARDPIRAKQVLAWETFEFHPNKGIYNPAQIKETTYWRVIDTGIPYEPMRTESPRTIYALEHSREKDVDGLGMRRWSSRDTEDGDLLECVFVLAHKLGVGI